MQYYLLLICLMALIGRAAGAYADGGAACYFWQKRASVGARLSVSD